LDLNLCEGSLEEMDMDQKKMYALGQRFAQLKEWVGQKTENQTPEMFCCKRHTAPNTVMAVARTKRRKTAYEKPRIQQEDSEASSAPSDYDSDDST
jgi:hypothetical protein